MWTPSCISLWPPASPLTAIHALHPLSSPTYIWWQKCPNCPSLGIFYGPFFCLRCICLFLTNSVFLRIQSQLKWQPLRDA